MSVKKTVCYNPSNRKDMAVLTALKDHASFGYSTESAMVIDAIMHLLDNCYNTTPPDLAEQISNHLPERIKFQQRSSETPSDERSDSTEYIDDALNFINGIS